VHDWGLPLNITLDPSYFMKGVSFSSFHQILGVGVKESRALRYLLFAHTYNLFTAREHSRARELKHKSGLAVRPWDLLYTAKIAPTEVFAAH
jgi:hypothetical protein